MARHWPRRYFTNSAAPIPAPPPVSGSTAIGRSGSSATCQLTFGRPRKPSMTAASGSDTASIP